LKDYIKLNHKSIVSSLPSGTKPYDLPYDYRKLITNEILGNLNFISSLFSTYRKLLIRLS